MILLSQWYTFPEVIHMQTESTAEQLKKEFQMTLSKLGHEIRNPIALIVSELQLMASSHPEICTWQGWDSLTDNLDYVRELLNQISDFSHAGTIFPIPTNPTDFLRQVLSSEKHTLDYLGITLESHLEEISSPVFIDRIKMRQALLNLIRNSCEAIDHPKGRITACLRKNDNGICISISDNGCGMTQDQLQHVWTPFVTYKPEGTGLGLAVVQEIVLAHHGHITLTSTPGQGSAFHIFLDDTEVLPV